ncbi:FAD-binding oxidoreductase [Neobacillus sp. DY30]|uniref:FAD-binding oxidoreductase n=1 Tax=Neobacillus sp. DY30 TaxID=3047871 RepID=UPI0024C0491E|nr:FAD-binding oxidoreductase [Neobacillus sp. DY30]WHX98369.1 FAD-binding oxidoreductase [Neobacillus sp. DY30]
MISDGSLTELKSVFKDIQISDEDQDHPLGNSGRVTIFPKTEQEISSVLEYANNHKHSVFIMGGGTKRGFGGTLEKADILLSLAQYTGIVEHNPGDMIMTVKAGTTFQEMQNYLTSYKQKVPLDPFMPKHATIGGIVSSNDSGPKRLGYGSARDNVIGLKMVYPDGTLIRSGGKVVKNVAGYDMNKLFIGAMGTLGVVSHVTVKLRPIAKYESILFVSFAEKNVEEIKTFAAKVLDSMIEPISLEILNPFLAEKLTKINQYTLLISFEDVKNSVYYQENVIRSIVPDKTTLRSLSQNEAKSFWDNFYHQQPNSLTNVTTTEAVLKIGVVNLNVIKILREAELISDACHVSIEAHGGLGTGICHMSIRGANNDVLSAIHQIRKIAMKHGGYAIVKHLPFSLRKEINAWGEKTAAHFLFEGIKHKIDSNKLLNKNRYVGGI